MEESKTSVCAGTIIIVWIRSQRAYKFTDY